MKRIVGSIVVLVLTLILISCTPQADNGSLVIEGVITSESKGIENALVKIRNTTYEAQTDKDGKFLIELSLEETATQFRLIVTAEGYEQATINVIETDFVNKKATVLQELKTVNVTLFGVVSNQEGPLKDVKVTVFGTSIETLTDDLGKYELTMARPLEAKLVFSKEFYLDKEVIIDNFNSASRYENNVNLEPFELSVEGKVFNYYTGNIANATVKIVGTDYKTTTDAQGKYKFENLLLESNNFEIEVEKEGYLKALVSSEEISEIELVSEYMAVGELDSPFGVDSYVTKSSKGLYFKFITDEFRYENGKEEKVQLFLNLGNITESTRMGGSHTVEFALTSNNDIIVVVSYLNGLSFITSIDWLTEVIYKTNKVNDRTELTLFIDYKVFGEQINAELNINADSVIGFTQTFWSDFTPENPAYQWYKEDMLGLDGTSAVFHDNPEDWVRLSADGKSIYEGNDNKTYTKEERTLNGIVKDKEGNVLPGVSVAIPHLNLVSITNEEGKYEFLIPLEKFAVSKLNIVVSNNQIVTTKFLVLGQDFTNGKLVKDFEVEKLSGSVNVQGHVHDNESKAIVGVTVGIKGTDYTTLTNENGEFSFTNVVHHDIPYILTFSKEGFEYAELTINSASYVIEAPVVMNEAINVSNEPIILDASTKVTLGVIKDLGVIIEAQLVGTILTLTYTDVDGVLTNATEVSPFMTFKDSNVYELRFNNGWTGVWNLNNNAWEGWNPKIGVPAYNQVEGITVVTQVIDLSYFSDLSVDITSINLCFTIMGKQLVYNDEVLVSLDVQSGWIKLS